MGAASLKRSNNEHSSELQRLVDIDEKARNQYEERRELI